jgi:hypothetical protein
MRRMFCDVREALRLSAPPIALGKRSHIAVASLDDLADCAGGMAARAARC